MRSLMRFMRNIILWLDILKSDEQWDYVFLEKVILHKLKLMKNFYDSGQNYTTADDTVKELNITINALERLINDNYIHFPEGKEPKIEESICKDTKSTTDSEVYKLKTVYHEDFGEEEVDNVYRDAKDQELKDRKLVYEMLEKNSTKWWD